MDLIFKTYVSKLFVPVPETDAVRYLSLGLICQRVVIPYQGTGTLLGNMVKYHTVIHCSG
jgi:hypothetical protein